VPHESLVHVLRTDFADYLQRPNLVLSEDGELDEGLHAAGIHVAQPAAVHWRGDNAAWDSAYSALTKSGP
jgi:hypothetical protein